ncbi:hypothetical protein BaRGS_00024049 [Batillaria attramentaria]|uniref:Uncharacterized protein n=1 Tax=Batillaria attramentaria TaxID=370345 RepID=A0ABD0KCE2_9CAEN
MRLVYIYITDTGTPTSPGVSSPLPSTDIPVPGTVVNCQCQVDITTTAHQDAALTKSTGSLPAPVVLYNCANFRVGAGRGIYLCVVDVERLRKVSDGSYIHMNSHKTHTFCNLKRPWI